MHPMVKPALRRAWRNLQYVQFGVTPAHAVVVGPVDTTTGSLIGLMDGTRGIDLLRAEGRALGLDEDRVDVLVSRLAAAGLLADATAGREGAAASGRRGGEPDPVRADLESLSVVHREPDGAVRRWSARRTARVQVRGAGRVGAAVAALLSASGVGRVEVLDSGPVEPWDVSPGGLPPEAVGERRATAARRLVGRSAPGGRVPRARQAADAPGAGAGRPVSLIVVAPRDGLGAYLPDPVPAGEWVAAGTPHLYAGVAEATGVVGPLVLPGGTACAGCMERERTDREPVWPRMLAQWRSGGPGAVPACDLGLATVVAGLAAAHALAFLDGELPASVGARWETSSPLLEWRSERVVPYAGCDCGAVADGEGERASGGGAAHDTMAG
ncbi:ThiF family adenylyltransferase [Streptomyces purpureus]|uniref:ThiF family adenylyltransferase n=1 Tax=Streptomyces purpureus TaxID=1951 RepID=UPI0037BC7E6D